MFGIAHTHAQFTSQVKVDVAGHAGAAEHDAAHMPRLGDRAQEIIGNVVAADQQRVRIGESFRNHGFVGGEFLEHPHAGDIMQLGKMGFDRIDHRIEDGRHYNKRQICALRLGFIHFGHDV